MDTTLPYMKRLKFNEKTTSFHVHEDSCLTATVKEITEDIYVIFYPPDTQDIFSIPQCLEVSVKGTLVLVFDFTSNYIDLPFVLFYFGQRFDGVIQDGEINF